MTELEVLQQIRALLEVGVFCLELCAAFLAGGLLHRWTRGR
jgi:hypothetical protein